jgi:hypothetical protein
MTLGVRRPTVSLVIQSFRRAGLLGDARARILIRDRRRLEAASCKCYALMQGGELSRHA